jgi:hypothetical protein
MIDAGRHHEEADGWGERSMRRVLLIRLHHLGHGKYHV